MSFYSETPNSKRAFRFSCFVDVDYNSHGFDKDFLDGDFSTMHHFAGTTTGI
jgi:hypothetical protein